MPKYIMNGKSYNIPDNLVGKFEKENPNATMSYSAGGKKYNIPVSKKEKFLKAFPDATNGEQPVREEKPTPQPAQQPQQPAQQPVVQPQQKQTPITPVQQQAQPQPTQLPEGFGMLDLGQAQQMGMGKGPMSWEQPQQEPKEETVVEKQQRMMSGKATPQEQKQVQKRLQQRMDEAEYESQTGKRLRHDVITPEWEAPTVARDDYGNMRHTDNGDIIKGFTTDENAVGAHQQIVQEQEEFDNRPDIVEQAQQRLDEVNAELDPIEREQMKQFVEQQYNQGFLGLLNNALRQSSSALGTGSPYDDYQLFRIQNKTDKETSLQNRKRLLEYGLQLADDARKDAEMEANGGGILRGLARAYGKAVDVATDKNTWDFGSGDMQNQMELFNAVIRDDNGVATEDDKKLLDDFAISQMLEQQSDLSGWTKAGLVTGQSLPFMLEMFATRGGALGTKMGEQYIKYAVKKYGTKYVRDHLKSVIAKKVGAKVVGDLVASHLMAGTTGSMRTAANAYERMRGDMNTGVDENGRIIYDGHEVGDSAFDAFSKAWRDTAIENWSEMAGEYLPVMTGFFGNAIGKAAIGKAGREALKLTGKVENVGLNKVQKFIYDLAANKGIGTFSKGLDSFLKRTQWHGVLGEYSEEVLGNLANALTIGDMTLDTAEGTGVFNLQQNIDTFNGVALMGGFTSALQTGGFGLDKYRNSVGKRDKEGSEKLGKDWERIKTAIDSSVDDARELNNVLTDFLGGNITDKEQKQAILNYTSAVLQNKGAEMANYKPRMESSSTQEVSTPEGKKFVVSSLDRNGETISEQAFDTEDEAKAYEGELKMQQEKQDFDTYFEMSFKPSMAESVSMVDEFLAANGYNESDDLRKSAMMAAINDPNTVFGKQFQQFRIDKTMQKAQASQAAIAAFEEEQGWTPGTVKWLTEQDPMELDSEGLQMADDARNFLEGLAYPSNEVHVEHEQQKGTEAGQQVVEQVVSTEEPIDPQNNIGKDIQDQWDAAQAARNQMFANDTTGDIQSQVEDMEAKGFSPQEILSSLDTFSPAQRQVMTDYYNAKAKYESMVNEAAKKIDEEAAKSRQRHTFMGTINGNPDKTNVLTITDGTNTYTLVSGKITTDSQGNITGSDSGLVIGLDDTTGEFVQLSDTEGYSVAPNVYNLDTFERMERERLQTLTTSVIMPNGPQVQQTVQSGNQDNVGGEAGATTGTGANEPPATTPETQQGTALDRIPKDEGGNPLYEQASPEDSYDALVEQVGEQTARIIAQKQLDTAKKALEKLNKKMEKGDFDGNTIQEQIASSQALQQAINAEHERINYWQKVLAVPNNRLLNESIATTPAATVQTETPETPSGEAPEYRYDTPQAARDRGYKVVEGQKIDRQEEKPMPEGKEVEVQYSTKDNVKGRMTVSELDEVQGSHLTNGQVNQKHFIPEAQPKSEFGADRQAAAQANASEANFRPELMLTFNGTQSAYSGSAPQTNRRGEVIQGNGRRNLAEYIYAPGNEASARRYKEYLKAHAAELGTTPEAIEAMEKPFAHIVLDVADEDAIRLGQFTAADLETGGKVIPNVQTTVTKLGDKYTSFTNILLRSDDPDASLAECIDANKEDAIDWLNRGGYINNTEAKSLLEDKDAARQFMKDMLTDIIFKDANPDLRTMFYELPKNIQSALVSVIGRELTTSKESSILKDIQESIQAYHELMTQSPEFAAVSGNSEKRYSAALAAVNDWLRQIYLDGSVNQGKFSNFAIELAIRYRSLTDQKTLAGYLRDYYDLVNGSTRQLGMFEEPTSERMTKEQAIKKIFGIEYGRQGTVPVAGDVQGSTEGGEIRTGNNQNPERGETEGRPADTGGGNTGNAPEGGEQQLSERELYIATHPLSESEIETADASPAQKILARQYLNLNEKYVSEMAKAAYTYIYNKVNAKPQQGETRPSTETKTKTPNAPEKPAETPPTTGTQAGGTQNSAQAAAKAKMAAALAKLKKHGKKTDNNTDAYNVENLTPEQIEDMFEVVEAGAELGYTLLDGVESKEDWINQMREAIAEPLKDATGYNDTEVDELLNDMWNYPYVVGEQTKTVSEWAAEKGINVNENNNEQGERNVGTGDNVPGSTTVGGSTETGVGEQEQNDEGDSGTGGEEVNGEDNGGVNSGTQSGEQTKRGRQRTGSTGTTRGKTGGTRKPAEPGNLFGEDNGEGANDTPGIEQGGTVATVPENGIVVSENGKEPKKPLADITQEKTPYTPASIGGKYAIGSVIPSGIVDAIANAFKRLKERFFKKKSILDFVREELGYKSNEDMLSDFESGKTDGLAAEQIDAVGLAIGKMKDGKSFIVGDMTGVGKGRTAAALIRWGLQHGKKVVFVTTGKGALFSDMYRDLKDISCDYLPFVTNSDPEANITDEDGNKVVPHPSTKAQSALWQSGSDKLPRDKKGRQYDFVMTTYSQASNPKGQNGKNKLEWLKEYAKDAIVIMDESHNASGESNRGDYFKEIVQNAGGVTFLSATYAKRPDNMLLYAIRSSMSELHMSVSDMLQGIKDYGVAMQELMASALFGSGEMIRRERDMSDVKTTWTEPTEIYSEEEYEECRKTSDKTMAVINDIIDFQRDFVNPIVKKHEDEHKEANAAAALIGGNQVHTTNTSYKSQVSNIVNLMTYAMKAKKAAEMAIEQIKHGKKPVIAVENTLDSYIKELPDEIKSANFGPVFEKGIRFALKYMTAEYKPSEDGKGYKKIDGTERYFDATDELNDDGIRALENLQRRVREYLGDPDKIDLTLSPIDLVKQMIADAGYSCGEITGRSTQLVRDENGGYKKEPIRQNKKEAARKFNGGSKKNPLPENEQYQALVLNVAGATGISLHASKTFGNQNPRTMIILQPARDVNIEVQMRGRIDRTGQAHRGEYFYLTSPIPAEQKITMMLKQKLASLDAQSVGTKKVSSNKVESQDMDNKYGDEVCKEYLLEHLQDINAYLEGGLRFNNKTREWEGRPGLLYDVLKDLQRMPCEMQEQVINELSQRYADQIEYLNQNGINDLETTTMDLEATTIDKATFVKGKDNESENEFAHDTTIERVEVNVLKKPMRSSDIKKKMKELDALDEDGLPKGGVLEQTTRKVKEVIDNKWQERKDRYDKQEAELEDKVRNEHPMKEGQTEEEYEEMIRNWPSLAEMRNKHAADLQQYGADLQNQYNDVYRAAMYLKPGRPYLVPLTDDVGSDAAMMYGRFLGFQVKNGDPRQVQAVFAVKDSRAMITIPLVNQKKVIERILQDRYDMEIVALQRDENGNDKSTEEIAKTWDEWWDKMIPKNTNRQIRYMITGNVLQACGSLGKYKGQIVTFTRKNKETGEITLERGMLLAENFDPENFQVRREVEKKDIWDNYNEVKDDRSGISCYREGSTMVVKFEKRKGEKLIDHPAQKDQTLKDLAMNGEIRPSGKSAILCVIKENNVEKALEHLYKEYGYTKEELFVMPDSTEKPDAIVRTNRPWQEIIDEFSPKYGGSKYSVSNRISQMLKRYKMDVNNDDLKQQIREAVQLRQAYIRRDYAGKSSNRLAWEALIQEGNAEKYKDDKDFREEALRRREAILEELEYRGFKGKEYHYTQGKITLDDVRNMFNEMNDASTEEGKAKKALFDKVMAKVSKLPMEIFMNEKIDNDTGGWAGGRIVNYNWKYMNSDYISDQAKADTILHELIHTVTAYADQCVERGLEHLLDQDMIDAINELHSIFDAIKNDDTFIHDGAKAYGLTNVREMLSEAGSNSEFREDLKKTGLWARLKAGFLAFFGIKKGVDMPGAKQVNAYEQIMERLDYLIENFKQEAWDTFYQNTGYGGYGYQKQDAQKIDTNDPMEAISQANESWRSNNNARVGSDEKEDLEKVNERFNNRLDELEKNPNQKDRVLRLGYPGSFLKKAGIKNGEIIMEYDRFVRKSSENYKQDHPFSADDIKDLPKAINAPIAVFNSATQDTDKVILTELKKDGKNFIVAIRATEQPRKGGVILEVNEIQTLLPKNAKGIVKWILDDLFTLVDKKKALDWITALQTHPGTAIDSQELISAANIIQTSKKSKNSTNFNTKKKKNSEFVDRRSYDPMDSIERAADDFRDGQQNNPMVHSAKKVYDDRLNRIETVFTEAYQDAMISLKTAQNAIAKDNDIPDSQNAYMAENLMHGKTKNEQDLYNAEYRDPLIATINKIMNLTGMNWGDVDRYVYTKSGLERNREFFVRDWLEYAKAKAKTDDEKQAVKDIENGWQSLKEEKYQDYKDGTITFPEYLEALDKYIRMEMANDFNPEEHDYSGFRAMYGDEYGDYDESEIIDELMDTEDLIESDNVDTLWERINAATRYGLERYREAGMRSDEQIDNVEKMFHWYVPMRGFKEDTGEDMYQYFTGKDKAKSYIGGLLKHAKGRGSEANYPISTIFAMSYKAIADCNQNLVNQKLYRLCQANPNDLIILSDSWVVLNETTGEWEEVAPDIPEDADEEDVRQITLDWEEEMNGLAQDGKAKKIRGKANFDYKPLDKTKLREHIVEVRINGQKKLMTIVGNPRAAQALNGQLNFEREKGAIVNGAVNMANKSKLTKWFANAVNGFDNFSAKVLRLRQAVSTNYSLNFVWRNAKRDWSHFGMLCVAKEGKGYAAAAEKYYLESLAGKGGMRTLFKKYREGTLDESKEIERDFKDFMDNGGITGFVQMQKVDEVQRDLEKLMKAQKDGKPFKVDNSFWDKMLTAIEAYNEAIENRARFATYRASRHYAGRTKARSAYDAKEITANFNKRGAGRKTARFKSTDPGVQAWAKIFGKNSQLLNENKMFFNASVQAIATLASGLENADNKTRTLWFAKALGKRLLKYGVTPFALASFGVPMLNMILMEAFGGGDDGDDPYANLPEWVRRNNICIYVGNGNFATFAIGQELAAFYSIGDMTAGVTFYPELKPIDKDMWDEIIGFLSVFSPVDMQSKVTPDDKGWAESIISNYVARIYSNAAPLVNISENLSWSGRPIYKEDDFGHATYDPEYKQVFEGTGSVYKAVSKALNWIGGGDEDSRGAEWSQINPATMEYLAEQYFGGVGRFFVNTGDVVGDVIDVATGQESDFNIRKIEGARALFQQSDDRTQYYRTLAKFRNYKNEAEKLEHDIKAKAERAAYDPDAYMEAENLAKGNAAARMAIYLENKSDLQKINSARNKAEGSARKELNKAYNEAVKRIVDEMDKYPDE